MSAEATEAISALTVQNTSLAQKNDSLMTRLSTAVEREAELRADLEHQKKKLLQTMDKFREASECVICFDRARDTALVPCGHLLCSTCAGSLDTCSMCRQLVTQAMKLFLH